VKKTWKERVEDLTLRREKKLKRESQTVDTKKRGSVPDMMVKEPDKKRKINPQQNCLGEKEKTIPDRSNRK